MISLKNVNKYFFKGRPNEIHVINDVSMELPERGMIALFGKSGCGKTTLLNTIGGLDSIKSGSIEIDSQDISKNTDSLRNKYIGYIFQNYYLNLKVNIYENVAESLRLCGMDDEEVIRARVLAALTNVGMEKYIYRMPDTLSGGQKQRIAIARAIVKNPAIILADEPTGNLDEANTIAIMDLLKSISKEHLVLLVTHESNLVDHYCEQVIELRDGRIENIRTNDHADGYVARDKNIVYLGELEKKETSLGKVKLESYGDELPEDVVIRLVNSGGRLLLKCENPKVKLVDETSEITFTEKAFEHEEQKKTQEAKVDMSALPAFEGKNYGRLFNLKQALSQGVERLKEKGSKGSRTLRRGIIFFTVIVVMLASLAAKDLKSLLDAKDSYNHNTYYVYAKTREQIYELLDAADKGENGIDSAVPLDISLRADREMSVSVDLFESFSYYSMYAMFDEAEPIKGHGVRLPFDLLKDKNVLYGRKDELKDTDVVITSELADIFLANSSFRFINRRSDLVGLALDQWKIAGIVDCDEPAVYMSDRYLIGEAFEAEGIVYDETVSAGLSAGEAVYSYYAPEEGCEYSVGDTVDVDGISLKLKSIEYLGVEPDDNGETSPLLKAGIFPEMLDSIVSTTYSPELDSYSIVIDYGDGQRFTRVVAADLYEEALPYINKKKQGFTVSIDDYYDLLIAKAAEDGNLYVQVHASDNSACSAYLTEKFGAQSVPAGAYSLITPDSIYDKASQKIEEGLTVRMIVIGVFSALLCLCMYMIMRGSIMSRVKEVGVYRCIGVTRRNMSFMFMVESFLLACASILPGVLAMVGLMHLISHCSGIMLEIFMPWWIILPMLVLLYLVSIVCGLIPAWMLMTKTPAQIMAKYDV